MKRKIAVLQPAMASYRQAFLDSIANIAPPDVHITFYVGDRHFVPTVHTGTDSPLISSTGTNRYLLGRRVGWQRGVFRRAMSAACCIVELNPRNLNTWVILLLRRMVGKPTLCWGHAWPRAGRNSRSDRVRGLLRRLATGVVVYTEAQRQELNEHYPGTSISVAPNSLYPARELHPDLNARPDRSLVWIGRLVREKNPELALAALRILLGLDSSRVTLHIVGDGPLRSALDNCVRSTGLAANVRFWGHVDDPDILRPLFSRASASVCSGYVGLNVTQSLGFGCPVIWAEDPLNAPEVSVLDETNSFMYEAGDEGSLARTMEVALAASTTARLDRRAISDGICEKYSSEAMAAGFLAAVQSVLPRGARQ